MAVFLEKCIYTGVCVYIYVYIYVYVYVCIYMHNQISLFYR